MRESGIRYIGIVLVLVVVLAFVVGGSIGGGSTIDNPKNGGNGVDKNQQVTPIANQTIIYGQWLSGGTKIYAYNLATEERGVIASLPLDVKKVSVLPNEELLFIGEVNVDTDHGKSLSTYSIAEKKSHLLYQATDGYGIDDYVISPNKRYVAVWEVVFLPGAAVLSGGASRIRLIDRGNNGNAVTFFDELQTGDIPVHYPVAVTDNGEVYADSFLPNSGAGWSHGMGVASVSKQAQEDVPDMQNGTYGTQPTLSPDGRYLAFAGYLGSDGVVERSGFRTAVLIPNTVELLRVEDNHREVIAPKEEGVTYNGVSWDSINNKVIFTKIASVNKKDENGMYSYDLPTKKTEKMAITFDVATSFVSLADNGKLLLGTKETSITALGNLGEKYAAPFTSFSIMDNGKVTAVPNLGGLMQFIDMVPSFYLGAHVLADQSSNETGCSGYKNIQLCPFYLKPSLATRREDQQTDQPTSTPRPDVSQEPTSTPEPGVSRTPTATDIPHPTPTDSLPLCRDIVGARCTALGYQHYTGSQNDFINCKALGVTWSDSECTGSPLYLYGPEGKQVTVKVQTVVHESNVPYNGKYLLRLAQAGKFYSNNIEYESIAYGYTPGIRRLPVPKYGHVVEKINAAKILTEYAAKLGLTRRETSDLLKLGQNAIVSPYAFISFYDQATSEKILPLSFDPTPDTYQNIVFYIKNLAEKPSSDIPEPLFPQIPLRVGFIAIEISAIIE